MRASASSRAPSARLSRWPMRSLTTKPIAETEVVLSEVS
jgi:hypothetical protein